MGYAKTGDVIGYAKYTDIAAYINHYPITSYNINDYTVVVAEDLQNYGFDVEWNGANRTLSIKRNKWYEMKPSGQVYKYSSKLGQNSYPYLETDIVTCVNGQKVDSFNIGGKTCIYLDALSSFGEVVWVPEIRALKLWINALPMKEYEPLQEYNGSEYVVTQNTTTSENIKDLIEIFIDPTANGAASYVELYVTNKSSKAITLSALNFCSNLWQFKNGLTIMVYPGENQRISIYPDLETRQYYTTTYGRKKNTITVSADSLARVGIKYADGTDSHQVYFNCNGIQRWD